MAFRSYKLYPPLLVRYSLPQPGGQFSMLLSGSLASGRDHYESLGISLGDQGGNLSSLPEVSGLCEKLGSSMIRLL